MFKKKKTPENQSKSDLKQDFYSQDFDDFENVPKDYDRETAATLVDHVLLNRPLKAVLAMLIAAVVIPTVLYASMYGVAPAPPTFGTCIILQEFWSDCFPGTTIDKRGCENAGCCWNKTLESCFHSLPARQNYFTKNLNTDPEIEAVELTPRLGHIPFGQDALPLFMLISARTASHVVLQLASEKPTPPTGNIPLEESNVKIEHRLDELFWLIFTNRNNTSQVLFSTENGPLISSNGFWELSLQFPSKSIVLGGGSTARGSLQLSSGKATIYPGSRGQTNGRPFLMCISQTGLAFGILLESTGAIEIVSRKSNLVSVRSTTRDKFTLNVFTGDSPSEVIKQLTEYTGRILMPPYWALGLHICRDAARLSSHNQSLEFKLAAEIVRLPYDSDCIDDAALGNQSLTLDPTRLEDLNRDLTMLKNDRRHFLLSLFPQVMTETEAFTTAETLELFLKNENGTFLGWHRDSDVGYPDFLSSDVYPWLKDHLDKALTGLEMYPAGLALPENYPENEDEMFDDGSNLPIYIPEGIEGSLSNGTVYWLAEHRDGNLHYAVHAQYGSAHTKHAKQALTEVTKSQERQIVLTASKSIGDTTLGMWMGEEQPATWDGLKGSLLSILEAGLSGEPLSGGGSICGSRGDWNEALCTRWSLLALAAYPLVRYHHAWEEPPRDPTSMSESSTRVIARQARLRYELLPYMYTLVYEATRSGMPLLRAMALEFPIDMATWPLDEQVMLGPAILIAPVLKPTDVTVTVYLPKPETMWYYLQGGEPVVSEAISGEVTLLAGDKELLMLLRGGNIIVLQEEDGKNSASSAMTPRRIVAGLHCMNDTADCTAQGQLYLDDGISMESVSGMVTLTSTSTSLTLFVDPSVCDLSGVSTVMSEISILGVTSEGLASDILTVNGSPLQATLRFDSNLKRLYISGFSLDWCIIKNPVFEWQIKE